MTTSITLNGNLYTSDMFAGLGHTQVLYNSLPLFQSYMFDGLAAVNIYVTYSQNWASQTGSLVNSTDYSAKEYAIGTFVPAGSSKNWATLTGSYVTGTSLSAQEWSVGTYKRGISGYGSSKDWATLLAATVDGTSYSAQEYALGTTSSGGSAKSWATLTGAYVYTTLLSAQEWATGIYKRGSAGYGSAKDWATLTGSTADNAEYSAKEYANGTTVSTGSAKNWAQLTGSYVTGVLLSAQEWAVGTYKRGIAGYGSAKDWATLTGATADNAEYSAKEYAQGTTVSTGSAKSWASLIGAYVTGTALSAQEWAVGVYKRGVAGFGSAKDWATYTGGTVDGTGYSAQYWAASMSPATSTTALTIGTGSQSLTLAQLGKGFSVNSPIFLVSNSGASNWMFGTVTSCNAGTGALVVAVTAFNGSGSISDWNVSICGLQGPTGASGNNLILQGGTAGGTSSALTVSTQAAVSSVSRGNYVTLTTGASDSPAGTVTIAVDTSGAKTVKVSGSTTLAAGALPKNTKLAFDFDGTYWSLVSAPSSGGGYGAVFAF